MTLSTFLAITGIFAGAAASVAGFGIGSLLTPVLSIEVGTKLAVAAVSIPHITGTALRLVLLRKYIDRRILWSFGLANAAGGLLGALLHSHFENPVLTFVFSALLIFAGLTGITGTAERIRFGGPLSWIAGVFAGGFGGLVGNQGGIRTAAMLGFNIGRESLVATATAIALLVDIARIPVYIFTSGRELESIGPFIGIAVAGVVIGTFSGGRLLKLIPEALFRKTISALILALGIGMLFTHLK